MPAMTFDEILKYNHNHDASGRFSSSQGAGGSTSGRTGDREKAVASAESAIRGNSHETAHVIDKDGNTVFVKDGGEDSIEFSPRERDQMAGKTLTHNHPNNSQLSPSDVELLVHRHLEEVRAVGADGNTYSLKKGKDYHPDNGKKFLREYESFVDRATNRSLERLEKQGVLEKVKSGEVTREQAEAMAVSFVTERADNWLRKHAEEYHLVYEQTGPGVKNALKKSDDVKKYNHNHDSAGRFASGDGASAGGASKADRDMFSGKTWNEFTKDKASRTAAVDRYGKNPKEIKEKWRETNMKTSAESLHEISVEEADHIVGEKGMDNVLEGWFRSADSGYKPKIEELTITDPDLRNAAMNVAYENHKRYLESKGEKSTQSFDEWLTTPIKVYRGEHGQKHVDGDVFDAYSFDRTIAEKFGENVTELEIRPIDTMGGYRLNAEFEIMVPTGGKVNKPAAMTFDEVLKFNPYHGYHGYFSSANSATSMTTRTKNPEHQHWADMAMERAKQSGGKSGYSGNTASQTDHPNVITYGAFSDGSKFVQEQTGLSEQEANQVMRAVGNYSMSYSHEIRRAGLGEDMGRDEKHSQDLKDMAENIETFINKSPKWDGAAYHGRIMTSEEVNALKTAQKAGDSVGLLGISSWSSSAVVASDFSDPNNVRGRDESANVRVVFHSEGKMNGTSIRPISSHQEEHEILASKDAKFKINDMREVDGVTHIYTEPDFDVGSNVKKFNPYHGYHGYFSSANSATSMTTRTRDPKKQHMADMAMAREKERAASASSGGSKGGSSSREQAIASTEDKIRGQSYESAAVIDKDGKILFEKDGQEKEVSFTEEECAKMKDATLTHNHPNNTTFSNEDVTIFLARDLQEIRAVGRGGDTYSLRRGENFDKTIGFEFHRDYMIANNKATAKAQKTLDKRGYQEKIKNGEITIEQANREFTEILCKELDKWAQKNASKYGLIYEHTKNGTAKKGLIMKTTVNKAGDDVIVLDRDANKRIEEAFNEWLDKNGISREEETKKSFDIYKTDDDKRLVFGWASIAVTVDGQVLEDRQHDMIAPEDLEEAAYEYVLKFRDTGEEHLPGYRKKGKLVESCVLTEEKQRAMGIPEGVLPVGWWIGFKIEDDDAWRRVKDGTYRMFSIEGKAQREEVVKTDRTAMTFEEVLKYNHNHDSRGRFSSGNGGSGGSSSSTTTASGSGGSTSGGSGGGSSSSSIASEVNAKADMVRSKSGTQVNPIKKESVNMDKVKERGGVNNADAQKCVDLANNIYDKAAKVEPKITNDVTNAVKENNGQMYGLDFRMKQPTSMAGKVAQDVSDLDGAITFEQSASDIKDAIRYTAVFENKDYVKGYNNIKKDLESQGYEEVRCKNYWKKYQEGKSDQKALQCVYKNKDGQLFEFQFHTYDSQGAKELNHPLYEEQRAATTGKKRKQELSTKMKSIGQSVNVPDGILHVPEHDSTKKQ